MIELLRVIGYLAMIGGAGAEINTWLRSATARTSLDRTRADEKRPLGWGWSYLVGVAALGTFLYVPLALKGHLAHSDFATAWACCGILSVVQLARHFRPNQWRSVFRDHPWFDLPGFARCIVLVIFIAAAYLAMFTRPTSFDGRATFALKAKILYDGGTLQGEDFQDPDRVHFNAHYPLLIPLLEAELFWVQGSSNDLHLRTIFLAFVMALASIVYGETRRCNSAGVAALATALLLGIPLVIQAEEGAGLSTEADLPLACLVVAGTLAVMDWLRSSDARQVILGCLMFGAAAMTKDEGMLWIAAAGMAMLLLALWHGPPLRRIRPPAIWFGIALLTIMLSLVVAVRRQVPFSPYLRNYAAVFQWDWLRQLWRRPPVVVWHALKNCFRTSKWNLIWPCIAAALLLRRNRRLPLDVWYARGLAAIMSTGFLLIFVLTPYPLHWHLQSALYRLFLQLLPLAWLLAVEQLSASGWTTQLTNLWTHSRETTSELLSLDHAAALRQDHYDNRAPLKRAA